MSARKEFEDVELPEAPADAQRFLNGDVDAHAGAVEYPGPSQPYKVAQQVMRELYSDAGGVPTLTYWRGDWWMYSGTHWEAVSGSAKDADLVIAGQLLKVFDSAVYSKKESNTVTLVPWSPNRSKISEIIFALKPLAYAVVSDTDDASSRCIRQRQRPLAYDHSHTSKAGFTPGLGGARIQSRRPEQAVGG